MKRQASKSYGTFKLIHPLTNWCFCLRCKQEATRELIWKVTTRNNKHIFYFCKECAPTANHVKQFCKFMFSLFVSEVK